MVISTLALLWYFAMVAIMWAGQWLRREPQERKSCRILEESVRPYVQLPLSPSPLRPLRGWPRPLIDSGLSEASLGLLEAGPGSASEWPGGDWHTDGWTDVRTDSPCFTGLRLLRFPLEPLPCSHNCYHYKIPEQGKGTVDHLLPLGDWFWDVSVHQTTLVFSRATLKKTFFVVTQLRRLTTLTLRGFWEKNRSPHWTVIHHRCAIIAASKRHWKIQLNPNCF